jgi:hypothetical protein
MNLLLNRWRRFTMDEKDNVKNQDHTTTILVFAYIIVAIGFFIVTVFFNSDKKMVYPRYIPENKNIGNDFLLDYNFGARYFVEHKSAYIGDDPDNWYTQNAYPPLFTLFLYPLFRFGFKYLTGYYIVAALILFSFLWMVLVLPFLYYKKKSLPPVTVFVLVTGLTSYGLQFALERGQFDLISIAITLSSVMIFWYFPKWRWLAYGLFIIGFQFKVYPFIFILCMVEDWHDWKKNLLRLGGITLATFASLFVMGIKGFTEFLRALTFQFQNSATPYPRDHGVNNGIDYLYRILNWDLSQPAINALKLTLMIIGFLFLLIILALYLKKMRKGGLYPPLLLACMLSAMVLFPASKDYKLGLLCGVFCMYVIYLQEQLSMTSHKRNIVVQLLFGLVSLCYSAVLFSEAYRPDVLKNSFPILYGMFIVITIIELILYEKDRVVLPSKS